MTLIVIFLATLLAGIGSVWLAALLLRAGLGSDGNRVGPQHLLSLAAGALLATAFMHLLPEAFEAGVEPHELFTTLLVGLVFFFLLDKAELWHHGHEHGGHHAHAGHGHVHHQGESNHHDQHHRAGGWAVLTGDSFHCFGDGILIASAFMADVRLGWVAALSVLAHEVPHHMGDLVVLLQSSPSRHMALIKVSLAGSVTALGGVVGYLLLDRLNFALPYFIVVAASSFLYVALADLIPQLQKRLSAGQTVVQVLWLLGGIALVTLIAQVAHQQH